MWNFYPSMWNFIHRAKPSSSGGWNTWSHKWEGLNPRIKDKIHLLSHWEGKISLCKVSLELDHEWHPENHHRPLHIAANPSKLTNAMEEAAGIRVRNGILNGSREDSRSWDTQSKWNVCDTSPGNPAPEPPQAGTDFCSPSSYPGLAGKVQEANTSRSLIAQIHLFPRVNSVNKLIHRTSLLLLIFWLFLSPPLGTKPCR